MLNLSDEELDACVKFMDYYQSDENVAEYGEYYNVPLPVQGAEAPAEQVNVNGMLKHLMRTVHSRSLTRHSRQRLQMFSLMHRMQLQTAR